MPSNVTPNISVQNPDGSAVDRIYRGMDPAISQGLANREKEIADLIGITRRIDMDGLNQFVDVYDRTPNWQHFPEHTSIKTANMNAYFNELTLDRFGMAHEWTEFDQIRLGDRMSEGNVYQASARRLLERYPSFMNKFITDSLAGTTSIHNFLPSRVCQ